MNSNENPFFSEKRIDRIAENITLKTIVSGLNHPWGMVWLPNGDILITERAGNLRIVKNGQLQPRSIAGIPDVYNSGQGGLLDISLHPNFEKNRWLYFTYSHGSEDSNQTRVARAKFTDDKLTDWQLLFEVTPVKSGSQHFGSRIIWLPDQTMLIAIGDGGNPPLSLDGDLIREQAQKLDSALGKVLRLNDDGSIPDDNPFVNSDGVNPAVWSYGHRNIQGMTIDLVNNRIWSTEHGSRGGDELNLLIAGENYGWPKVSYSYEYYGNSLGRSIKIGETETSEDTIAPKVVWTPSMAPSGLAIYNHDRFAQWQGDLFAGGLASRDLRRLDLDEQGNVIAEESIAINSRVRDVKVGEDGRIYILTDESNGKLIAISPN